MPSTDSAWTVGELARRAGVTVRTLHYYDRLGLLSPQDYSEAGYRLYGQQALLQLQQILTLKALGLPLEHIQQILADPAFDLRRCLNQQKQALQARRQELQQAIETIEALESQLEAEQTPEPELLFKIMEVIQLKQSQSWMARYYSPEQLKAFEQRGLANPDEARQGTQAWEALFAEIRSYLDRDPASPEVQALLPQWLQRQQELIQSFTQGNQEVMQSLQKLYADINQAPPQVRHWYEQWADVRRFLEQAKHSQTQL